MVLLSTEMAPEVIAALGAIFDIEPLFFATAIDSYREAVRDELKMPKLCVQSVSWATMPRFLDMCKGYCAKVIPNATIDGHGTDLTVGENARPIFYRRWLLTPQQSGHGTTISSEILLPGR